MAIITLTTLTLLGIGIKASATILIALGAKKIISFYDEEGIPDDHCGPADGSPIVPPDVADDANTNGASSDGFN